MSTTTTRNKNLLSIIAVLFLTNIAVLAYFLWVKKPCDSGRPPDPRVGMTERLKEVGFTDEQVAKYKQLKDEQKASIKPMFDEMRKAKDSLFHFVDDPNVSDSVLNKAADVIAQKQKALDLQTFHHFQRVRALCTPEQLPKYDSMMQKMLDKMMRPPRRDSTKAENK